MKTEITWTGKTKKTATVTVELVTSRRINLDGHITTVDDCEINITATVDGIVLGRGRPVAVKRSAMAARIGNLGIPTEQYAQITTAIEQAEASGEYQAELATSAANLAAAKKYEQNYARVMHAMAE